MKAKIEISIAVVCALLLVGVLAAVGAGHGHEASVIAEKVLNRYQTLIAGVLAIIAAYYAARPVYDELAETQRQSAATARSAMKDHALDLENERERKEPEELIVKVERSARAATEIKARRVSYAEVWVGISEAFAFTPLVTSIDVFARRYDEHEGSIVQNSRLKTLGAAVRLAETYTAMRVAFRGNAPNLAFFDHTTFDVDPIDFAARNLLEALEIYKEASDDLRLDLTDEIYRAWLVVRKFEVAALGHGWKGHAKAHATVFGASNSV